MPQIIPFKALLPAKGLELEVSANTHVDDRKRQIEIVSSNKNSYLQIVKPHLTIPAEKLLPEHYAIAKQILNRLISEGVMVQETKPTLYVYQQKNNEHTYLGLICHVSSKDYLDGKIKVHENTLTEKENILISHIKAVGAIGEPVLLTHAHHQEIDSLLHETINNQAPDIEFTDELYRIHYIYKVNDEVKIKKMQSAYSELDNFYIADGHHRSAACAKANKEGSYLTYIVPSTYLHIDSFYRAYKASSNFNLDEFLQNLSKTFTIEKSSTAILPQQDMHFGVYTSRGWYSLRFINNLINPNAVEELDVSIIEKFVFTDILKITDSKTDKQLSFIRGNVPVSNIENQVDKGNFDFVFTIKPCTIDSIFKVADNALIMPPKSTYIEPKLRTGLTVQLI